MAGALGVLGVDKMLLDVFGEASALLCGVFDEFVAALLFLGVPFLLCFSRSVSNAIFPLAIQALLACRDVFFDEPSLSSNQKPKATGSLATLALFDFLSFLISLAVATFCPLCTEAVRSCTSGAEVLCAGAGAADLYAELVYTFDAPLLGKGGGAAAA